MHSVDVFIEGQFGDSLENQYVPQRPPVPPTIYLTGMKFYDKVTYISKFIASHFTMTKIWKQPRCSLTDDLIKKM